MTKEDEALIFPEAHSTVNQILETIGDFGVSPTDEQVEYGIDI